MVTKTKSNIDLSIWMISYNHAPYIREALDSVLMQKTKYTYEILISDDASNDGTLDIIREYAKKYPDRIRAFISKENHGSPRPVLIEHNVQLRGNYWCILEADDYWIGTDKIEKQLDFLYAHKDCIGSSHAYLVKDQVAGTESITRASLPEWNIYKCLKNIITPTYYLYCHTSTWIWKNVFLNNHSSWIEFLKDKRAFGDVALSFRMMAYGKKVKYFDDVLSCYRLTGKGAWSSLTEENRKRLNAAPLNKKILKAVFLKHKIYYYIMKHIK